MIISFILGVIYCKHKEEDMERKYIMIDSTYRDRLLYPNPAQFILPINATIGNNPCNSKNPLLDGYPVHSFCFLDPSGSFTGTVVAGNPRALQVDASIDTLTGLSDPTNGTTLQQAIDIFVNLSLMVAGDANMYRVISYDAARRIIYLDTSVLTFMIGMTYTLMNPSTNSTIVLQGYSISMNGFTSNTDGYFLSQNKPIYVWDMTLNEVQVGTLVNDSIQLATPFSMGWSVADKYTISIATPISNGYFSGLAPGTFYLHSGIWQLELCLPGEGYIAGGKVQIVAEGDVRPDYKIAVGRVVYTNSSSGISRIELLYCGDEYQTGETYYLLPMGEGFRSGLATIRVLRTAMGFKIHPTQTNTLVGSYFMPMIFTAEFQLDPTDPTLLQINPNNSLPYTPNRTPCNISMLDANSLNGVSPIVDVFTYEGVQVILTLPVASELYQRFQCTNIGDFPEAMVFEVLPFLRDGVVNMDYRGTMVSSNQMVCYALSINTLILPNQILNLPFGSLTSSYPYVLLEITNETAASGHNKSILYSNNPNTVSATFICSISDVNSPFITKFINISSDRSTQILKFKPNDNLRFRVSMPDGRSFETEVKDYLPPLQPNPLLQINCLVEIMRLA